jgi:hypothetical protein
VGVTEWAIGFVTNYPTMPYGHSWPWNGLLSTPARPDPQAYAIKPFEAISSQATGNIMSEALWHLCRELPAELSQQTKIVKGDSQVRATVAAAQTVLDNSVWHEADLSTSVGKYRASSFPSVIVAGRLP